MSDLILHHYPASPFAEKIRLILGYKQLPWQSVLIPTIMPKPDLTALTGGYRRTPVLQIGADIYCDTALICQVLEKLAPQRSLRHADPAIEAAQTILAQWADQQLFWTCITWAFQPKGAEAILGSLPPEQAQAFGADRKAMKANAQKMSLAEASACLPLYLQRLQDMLQDGRAFLFGTEPVLADFCCYHPLWFIANIEPLRPVLQTYPAVCEWLARMAAFGHAQSTRLKSEQALAVAQQGQFAALPAAFAPGAPCGQDWVCGSRVQVLPSDYAFDTVEGELMALAANQIVLRRTDERAGTVHVHFPRIGFQLKHGQE